MFKKIIVLFLLLYLFIVATIIKYASAYGWDDGSITLAFGKSLAYYGKYSLNHVSEVVEGSSSNLLVFFTTIIFKLFHPDFYQIITWAQYNALLFALLTFFFLYKLLHNKYSQWEKLLIIVLISLFPMFFMEIMNGMEMTMFSSLLVLFIYLYRKKSHLIYFIIFFLLLVRFEAVFYLMLSLLLNFIYDLENRKYNIKLLVCTMLFFLVLTGIRFFYFGQILPNTILAKMNPPYSGVTFYEIIRQKLGGLKELLKTFSFILFSSLLLIYYQRKSYKKIVNLESLLIVSFFVFSVIAGENSGYSGRMLLPVLPVMILFFTDINWQNIENKFNFTTITLIFGLTILGNYNTFKQAYNVIISGGFYQKLYLPKSILETRKKLNSNFSGVTPENYRITGVAVDNLRKNLQLNKIKFLTPDVGGIALSTDKIIILDSALLTNQFLANKGYAVFYYYLENNAPDVIETHGVWSENSKIYTSPFFRKNYIPIIFENNYFWLNKIHLNKLKSLKKYYYIDFHDVPEGTRYFVNDILPFKNPKILMIL